MLGICYNMLGNENFVMSSHMSFCLTRFEGQNNTFDLYIDNTYKVEEKMLRGFPVSRTFSL